MPLLADIANELGRDRPPEFPRALIEDDSLAHALAKAHQSSTSGDKVYAETSMLIALRQLVLRHGESGHRPEPIEISGSRRRFELYQQASASLLRSLTCNSLRMPLA
jgi:hypothetical protein